MEKLNGILLDKAKAKNVAAFEELILPFEKLVYNISYRMLGNIQDAKDVSQEVWLKVYKNIAKCKDIESFKAWVCTIANNSCIDFLRKRKSRIQADSIDKIYHSENGDIEMDIEAKDEPSPEDMVIDLERKKAIGEAIGTLNPTHKAMIIYRDINGFTYEEIAEITNQNIGTVKSQISRARGALRKILLNMMEQGKI